MKKGVVQRIFVFGVCLVITVSLCGCTEKETLKGGNATTKEKAMEESATEKEVVEEAPDFLYKEAYCYAYSTLNEWEGIWYQNIADCLGKMQEEIRLDIVGIEQGLDETDIDRIFQCVLIDHPELFYVDGYTYTKYNCGDEIVAIEFSGTYSMGVEQVLTRKSEIETAVQPLLESASGFVDDYGKVKFVYDTLIYHTEYDLEAPDNQNIYSVFVNHKSVCQGYAKAVQYLLHRMGVECTLVQGSVDTGEGHAWNLVKVNGSYYYVDATWGDASYQPDKEHSTYVPEINYDYLCVTTEQLLRTHILGSYMELPMCVDDKDNYYVREGALFSTYDKEQMQVLFEKFVTENRSDVTVKCRDVECFHQIMTALVEEQEIFDYLKTKSDTIAYSHNEKQLSMTFWVTNE